MSGCGCGCKCGNKQTDCDLCGDPLPKDHKRCKCCGRSACKSCLNEDDFCIVCVETEHECPACKCE